MRKKLIAWTIAAMMIFTAAPTAMAWSADDFNGGALSDIIKTDTGMMATDTFNKVIWKIEGDKVTQYAGKIAPVDLDGQPYPYYKDGKLAEAYFMTPWAIVEFGGGYAVTDTDANVVRYIIGDEVKTLIGNKNPGSADGTGTKASLNAPTGLAVDNSGNLYIADTGNGSIRKMDSSGAVTTPVKGLASPAGLAWHDGTLYIAESGNNRICTWKDGKLEILVGGEEGYADGSLETAKFSAPCNLTVGADGTVYISDVGNSAIRRLNGERVSTIDVAKDDKLLPANPCGMVQVGDKLIVTDAYSAVPVEYNLKVGFADVDSSAWYAEAIAAAAERGVMSGIDGNHFDPDSSVTRAQFVSMLSRVYLNQDGTAVIAGDAEFTDVPEDEWYHDAMQFCADSKLVYGYDDGSFGPNKAISRQELVTILYRYVQAFVPDKEAAAEPTDLEQFSDYENIADYSKEALSWAVANGIMSGMGDGILAPTESTTRGQVARLIVGFMDAYKI